MIITKNKQDGVYVLVDSLEKKIKQFNCFYMCMDKTYRIWVKKGFAY